MIERKPSHFGSKQHVDLDGRDVLDRLGEHRRHRRHDRHAPASCAGRRRARPWAPCTRRRPCRCAACSAARAAARPASSGSRAGSCSSPSPRSSTSLSHRAIAAATSPTSSSMPAHASPRVGDELGHGAHGEVRRGSTDRELVPGHRHRHRRARQRPRAVGRGDGAVAAGLVEVDEDALAALLLPPRRGDEVGQPPLELAGDADDAVPHVEELVGRRDPGVDVHAAVAGRLGARGEPDLGHHLAQREGRLDRVLEGAARLRVEVDAQLVGVVGVGRCAPATGGR